jgi:two-component system, LytTR family, sensor histidine kinase NatK
MFCSKPRQAPICFSIKGEEDHISPILLKYKKFAEQIGKIVDYKLDVTVSSLAMRKINQVQLITNLLENVIESIRNNHSLFQHSSITLQTEIHDGIYMMKIKNSAQFENRQLLDSLFERFEMTSKEGEHQGHGVM